MAGQKILLPYNFTSFDRKALEFVINTYSSLKDAEITLFNAYMPVPEIEMRDSPIMQKMTGNLSYLSQRINEQEAELKLVKEKLVVKGFSENQIKTIFEPRKKDVADDIIGLAQNKRFDVVILSRTPGKVKGFFTGNVFSKVVKALKDTTVCIVS